MKRICSTLLALAMLCGTFALAACGDKGTTTTTGGTNAPSAISTGDGTEAITTEPEDYPDDIYTEGAGDRKPAGFENVDFNGKTFVFETPLDIKNGWDSYEVCVADENATDSLSMAIMRRNDVMAELYDCSIEQRADSEKTIQSDFATDSCHVDIGALHWNVTDKGNGQYYNLANYLNLDNPWWDQGYIRDMTVDNKLFSILGDFSLTSFDATWALFFNKEVLQQNDKLKGYNFYDLVDNCQWTMDTFLEVIQKAKQDDGDQVMTVGSGDIYGLVSSEYGITGLFYGGNSYVAKKTDDAAGNTTFSHGFDEHAANVVDKIIRIYGDESVAIANYRTVNTQINNGLTLFAPETLDKARNWSEDGLRNFGVLPYPAYSTEQIQTTGYSHYVVAHMIYTCVPTTINYDLDIIWNFLELYGYHSRYIVYPEYLNLYKYEYTNSEEDAHMVDVILSSRSFDLAYYGTWGSAENELWSGVKSNNNVVSSLGGEIGNVILSKANEYKEMISKVNN